MAMDGQAVISDPNKLLESLHDHLTEAGGIRRKSISELISLMSNTGGMLVPKCISLCVIAASEAAVKASLCDTEAWDILLKWLQESFQEKDFSFMAELMQVYYDLPVTLEQLRKNVCPKLINTLSKKAPNESVRSIAADIVKKWKRIISNSGKDNGELKNRKRKIESTKKMESVEPSTAPKEVKKRRTTVKVPPTVMRTAGIEDGLDSVAPKSRSEVLAKKNKIESQSVEPVAPIESFHQKITVTPTEPKKSPQEIQESFNFINALTHSQPVVRKKRKIPKPESATSELNTMVSQESDSSGPDGYGKSSITTSSDKKCRVTWAPDEFLTQICYFEVAENERVNVTRSLAEIRQQEHSLERQLFRRHEEIEISGVRWYPPVPLEVTPPAEPGSRSTERDTQLERERRILQAIYFTRDSIPFSPEEPDKEDFVKQEPIEIPMKDRHNQAVLVMNNTEDGSSKVSLNPNVADLVKSLALNFDQETAATTAQPSTSAAASSPLLEHELPHKPLNPLPNYPTHEHLEDPMHSGMRPPRMVGPPFMPGERGPLPPPHGGMRPRGPPMRPPLMPPGGGPMPSYRHPQYPPDGPPPRFVRGGGPMSRPPFRGPSMYNGGRPLMNPPPNVGRRSGRPEQICKFFQQGHCRNGSNCHFLHPGYQSPPNW